jgi:hypothetical protein
MASVDPVFDFSRPGAMSGLIDCQRPGCLTRMTVESAAHGGGYCRDCRKQMFRRAEAREAAVHKLAEQATVGSGPADG